MAGQGKISLAIRVKDKGGNYVFHKPVLAANGRLKPRYALIGDKPSHHPEGVYHVRFTRENGKRAYDKVGTDAAEAQNELHRRRLKQQSTEVGLRVVDPKDNSVLTGCMGGSNNSGGTGGGGGYSSLGTIPWAPTRSPSWAQTSPPASSPPARS